MIIPQEDLHYLHMWNKSPTINNDISGGFEEVREIMELVLPLHCRAKSYLDDDEKPVGTIRLDQIGLSFLPRQEKGI